MINEQRNTRALKDCLEWLRKKSGLGAVEWRDAAAPNLPNHKVVYACNRPNRQNPPVRRLEFDGHFRPDAWLVVFDRKLGTIGLFSPLPDTSERADVLSAIEQAAYLRHLCLVKAAQVNPPAQAWTVELVLLLAKTQQVQVQTRLSEILREAEYFYGIGVHLLLAADDADVRNPVVSEAEIGKACCWLLPQTRTWFRGLKPKSGDAPKPRPTALTLDNWRLPGTRTIHFAKPLPDHARVQLIHGPNGSGKSSLVEALELLATGKIERVSADKIKEVLPNINNSSSSTVGADGPTADATLEIQAGAKNGGNSQIKWSTKQSLPIKILDNAFSIILNQKIANEFIDVSDSQRRANRFIEAFFPKYQDKIANFDKESTDLNMFFKDIPPSIRAKHWPTSGFDDTKSIESKMDLSGFDSQSILEKIKLFTSGDAIKIIDELGLSPSQIKTMGGLFESNINVLDNSGLAEDCKSFDDDWRRLSERLIEARAEINRAHGLLTTAPLSTWQAVADATRTRQSPLEMLSIWAQTETLHRVLHRQWVNNCTLAEQGDPWPDGLTDYLEPLRAVWSVARADSGGSGRAALKNLRDQARQQAGILRTAWNNPTGGDAAPGGARQAKLDDGARRCLDSLSDLLRVSGDLPGLGQALHRAISEGQVVTVGPYVLGSANWAPPLVERLEKLEAVCAALDGQKLEPATVWLKVLRHARQVDIYRQAQEAVTSAFTEEIAKIYDGPLRELIAASTPARWAYPDIDGEVTREMANHNMSIRFGDKTDGELRLNTAELNVFVVMLFLLCAPRRTDNPWRLLVLDDPLQNMDELTVTALARTVARLARLLDPSWLVLMLFHGADDFERMATEIPAATLRLPWLRSAAADRDPISETLHPASAALVELTDWTHWVV